MLDLRSQLTTPGAATVLGNPGTIAVGDGSQTAGVPVGYGKATLKIWGANSPTADSIAAIKLNSQDLIDNNNGVNIMLGAASLLCQYFDYTSLKYVAGARQITMGTNVGVVAASTFTVDNYPDEGSMKCISGKRDMGGDVAIGSITFGGALTANQWSTVTMTPTQAMKYGRYAILGAVVTAVANNALIRFAHPSMGFYKPGFPVCNGELALATTKQIADREALTQTEDGNQFVYLSEVFGIDCCPVITIGAGGTGLNIEMCSCQADTPVVNLNMVYLGP